MFRRGRGLSWQDSLPRTMSARPLIGGQFPVGLWCVRVRAYAGFLGLRSASRSLDWSTEAEYVPLGDTIKEALFIRYVWRFIFPVLLRPV